MNRTRLESKGRFAPKAYAERRITTIAREMAGADLVQLMAPKFCS
jgi:hypothetical protein